MDNALIVRGLERGGDLPDDRQRAIEGQTVADEIGERRAIDQFHRDRVALEAVHLRDVGMVERGQDLGFPLEAREPIRVAGEGLRKDLERDVAVEPGVTGAVDLAHAAFPQLD
jgi:hypothetical protein